MTPWLAGMLGLTMVAASAEPAPLAPGDVGVASGALAGGAPRLLLLPSSGFTIRPALVDALRIQLAGTATVELGSMLAGRSTLERVAEAAALTEAGGATLAVWLETTEAGADALVFAARRHRERALIQVLTVPGGEEQADRILALKVTELAHAAFAAPAQTLGSDPARPPSAPTTRSPALAPGVAIPYVEIGLLAALGSASFGAQPGMAVAGGVRLGAGKLVLEPAIAVRPMRDLGSRSERAHVVLDEVAVGAGLRALFERPRWGAGAFVEIGLRVLDAFAVAPDGRTGSSLAPLPTTTAGAEIRLTAGALALVRAAVGIEAVLAPRHFTVDDETVARIGRARAVGQVSLVFPLR